MKFWMTTRQSMRRRVFAGVREDISSADGRFHDPVLIPTIPTGRSGPKSISEIPANGAAPALAVAIHDAVGVWMRGRPFTPEKILRAMGKIRDAGKKT